MVRQGSDSPGKNNAVGSEAIVDTLGSIVEEPADDVLGRQQH